MTYPADVLKTRIQTDFTGIKYNGWTYDCYKKSLLEENGNYKFLFKGSFITVIRALPVHAIIFYGYELAVNSAKKIFGDDLI